MGIQNLKGWATSISTDGDHHRDSSSSTDAFQNLEDAIAFALSATKEYFNSEGLSSGKVQDRARKIHIQLSSAIVENPFADSYEARVESLAVSVYKAQLHLSGVVVTTADLWSMLLCTLRYSMGRRSYITGFTKDLVNEFKKYLEPAEVDQIKREIMKELEISERTGQTLGDPTDHEIWKKLAESLH
jgi:hypothetical protein